MLTHQCPKTAEITEANSQHKCSKNTNAGVTRIEIQGKISGCSGGNERGYKCVYILKDLVVPITPPIIGVNTHYIEPWFNV